MIFVTLGTQDKEFKRLLESIQEQINKGNIKEEVIVQAGYTKFFSEDMKIFDYIDKDEFESLMKRCDILITHGGVGNIMTGLNAGKKIIAAARLEKYGEHTNDHQLQIVDKFDELGYVIKLDDFKKLDKKLEKARKMKVKKYKSNTENIVEFIESYIDNL